MTLPAIPGRLVTRRRRRLAFHPIWAAHPGDVRTADCTHRASGPAQGVQSPVAGPEVCPASACPVDTVDIVLHTHPMTQNQFRVLNILAVIALVAVFALIGYFA